jgi:hypothetical protein
MQGVSGLGVSLPLFSPFAVLYLTRGFPLWTGVRALTSVELITHLVTRFGTVQLVPSRREYTGLVEAGFFPRGDTLYRVPLQVSLSLFELSSAPNPIHPFIPAQVLITTCLD